MYWPDHQYSWPLRSLQKTIWSSFTIIWINNTQSSACKYSLHMSYRNNNQSQIKFRTFKTKYVDMIYKESFEWFLFSRNDLKFLLYALYNLVFQSVNISLGSIFTLRLSNSANKGSNPTCLCHWSSTVREQWLCECFNLDSQKDDLMLNLL